MDIQLLHNCGNLSNDVDKYNTSWVIVNSI